MKHSKHDLRRHPAPGAYTAYTGGDSVRFDMHRQENACKFNYISWRCQAVDTPFFIFQGQFARQAEDIYKLSWLPSRQKWKELSHQLTW
jgi:hypothetical protein